MSIEKKGLSIRKGVDQPTSINPDFSKKIKQKKNGDLSAGEYVSGIIDQDITLLSKSITLVESSLPQHQSRAQEIIEKCLPYSGKSIRIGITGVPGVGKSTFIETFGTMLAGKGKKVAVLAVDPSSSLTKGSILGDKTRMNKLSSLSNVFIRPSPSSGTLGGVARKTRETIILCEAAGFDTILVETVGVGQSEITVHSMVDIFLLLVLTGAGDELQGIKRGIMELVDLIVINKADDNTKEKVSLARRTYENALHLYPPPKSGWLPQIETCSSLNGQGIDLVWKKIEAYFKYTRDNNYFTNRRADQTRFWFYETINSELKSHFYNNPEMKKKLERLEDMLRGNKLSPFTAASDILKEYRKK